jgi:hypothetical protein
MHKILRFVGVINAAIWLGSAVFVTIGLPVVFSKEVAVYVQRPQVGIVAENILARYTVVQYWCAGIALVHLFAEHFLLGRNLARKTLLLLFVLLGVALLNGLWVQPKMRDLHKIKYWGTVDTARAEADKNFRRLHGVSQPVNLLVVAALVIYVWNVSRSPSGNGEPRFSTLSKIKS